MPRGDRDPITHNFGHNVSDDKCTYKQVQTEEYLHYYSRSQALEDDKGQLVD